MGKAFCWSLVIGHWSLVMIAKFSVNAPHPARIVYATVAVSHVHGDRRSGEFVEPRMAGDRQMRPADVV
jgi:hypothetical protein